MNARILQVRLVLLLALLSPLAALAQQTSWTATYVDGVAVMDEVSKLTFDVTNTSKNGTRLTEVTFGFNGTNYELDSAAAPTGWTVSNLNRAGKRVTFQATGTCPNIGLAVNAVARFSVRVVGAVAAADQNTETFVSGTSSTYARNHCSPAVTFAKAETAAAVWKRVGLSTTLQVVPRTIAPGGDVAVQVVVENRSSATHSNIQIFNPAPIGNATFQMLGVSPTTLSLAAGAGGLMVANGRATSNGTAIGQAYTSNGTVSSQTAQALQVNVQPLAAALDLSPSQALTGDTVGLRLVVTNTSTTETYRNIVPQAPAFVGTAAAALVSGPEPASVAALGPGESAQFVWRYRVTGSDGAEYRFQARVGATLAGAPVTSDLVDSEAGVLTLVRVTTSPETLQPGASRLVRYTVENRSSVSYGQIKLLRPATSHFVVPAANPFSEVPTGWTVSSDATGYILTVQSGQTPLLPNRTLTLGVTYTTITNVTADTPFRHRLQLTRTNSTDKARVHSHITVLAPKVVPEVKGFVVLSGEARNTLIWSNPTDHNGVLVLRSTGAAPNTPPTATTRYTAGSTLGNATVLHVGELSTASRYVDTAVTNGTEYFYRVYNMDDLRRYSAGNAPTSSGLRAQPQARGVGTPLWCYNVGTSSLMQPITEAGVGIFTSFNNSVIANRTTTATPATDGDERWRPVQLQGTIGGRFPVVPLRGLTGQYLLVGTQDGYMYALNAQTGEVLWRGENGQPLGKIQSLPVTQLYDFANAAYRAARNEDLVFFATRQDGDPVGNKVVALNGATGQRVWIYQPGDLDMVSGGMMVDYTNNRLYVPARSNGNTQASLRIVSTLNGQEVRRLSLGDIEHSVVRIPATNQVLVTANNGTVSAVGLTSMAVEWSATLPGLPTSFVRPHGRGFVATLQRGAVEYYLLQTQADGSTAANRTWTTPVPGPTGAFTYVKDGRGYVYVGGSDGRIYEMDVMTGGSVKSVSLGASQRLGTPTIDSSVSRLHVGTQDGRVCAFQVPFP
jgi:hypothetical protein